MTYFQKALAILVALILSVAFAHADKTGEQKDAPKAGGSDSPGPKSIEGGSSGTSTGGSAGAGPSSPKAPKKNNATIAKTKSMQKLTPDKAESGSKNIRRSDKH